LVAGAVGYGLNSILKLRPLHLATYLTPLSVAQVGGQPARYYVTGEKAPLIIELHAWGGNENADVGSDRRFDMSVINKGWNFIRPRIAPYNSPDGCCSRKVIDTVKAASEFVRRRTPVEPSATFVVGASGGGYTTLCAFMSGEIDAAGFIAWVPISDLVSWYAQHRSDNLGTDILQCTRSHDGQLNVDEARRRSPITMPLPEAKRRLSIYAGINDGFDRTGSVLPTHAMRFFNVLSRHPISEATIRDVLERRVGPDSAANRSLANGRRIHLDRKDDLIALTIFEGAHEFLVEETLRLIDDCVKANCGLPVVR
jgi:hypothetical protein